MTITWHFRQTFMQLRIKWPEMLSHASMLMMGTHGYTHPKITRSQTTVLDKELNRGLHLMLASGYGCRLRSVQTVTSKYSIKL